VKLPVYLDNQVQYLNKVNSKIVRRTVRTITAGNPFGFEEVVKLNSCRLLSAKAGNVPVTCIYIDRKNFLRYCD